MALLEKYRGTYETAQSAANYIDADGIIKNANKIKAELEEFNNLSTDVKTAGSDLNADTMYIDGLDCTGMVDKVATGITNSYTSMVANLDEIIAVAEKIYNAKQEEYNQTARYRDQQEKERRAAESSGTN